MENDTSKLVEDLENGDFLNDVIESNLEMDNLLVESNFVIETAETELKATIKDDLPRILEDDDTDSTLSIEVSEDLFKGLSSDITFSPIRYVSHIVDSKVNEQYAQPISGSLNNLLEEFNKNLKNYNETLQLTLKDTCNELNEFDNDTNKTIVADMQNINSNLPCTSKTVNIKSLVPLDSEEEHDYLYTDVFNTTLEVTVPNISENKNSSPVESKLKHYDYFEGCSQEFNSEIVGNDFTITLSTEHTMKPVKTNQDQTTIYPKYDNIEAQTSGSEQTKNDNCFANDVNVTFDHITDPELYNIVDQTTAINKSNNEISCENFNVTFENFIQSEIKNEIADQSDVKLQNINNSISSTSIVNVILENKITKEFPINNNKITKECSLNENNNIVSENLKRPGEEISSLENETKKLKSGDTSEKTHDENINLNEIISVPVDPSSSANDINFTQAIFDPEETADHNDPKWSALKDLETNEDYFKSVREQWRSLALPNPHKTSTTRYVPENIAKVQPHTATSSENERATSCSLYLENRIKNITREITILTNKLNAHSHYQRRSERFKIHKELEDLRNLRHEVEKNKEELKHINMFYYNDSQGWNANYLTQSELSELEEQDRILQFQKTFYK